MPLVDIELAIDELAIPGEVSEFLREADERVRRFVSRNSFRVSAFVPSDYVTVYRALRAIATKGLATGNSFCEWGSGLGVVASLAAMLEFDACGIEIERDLVDAAEKLAAEFDLPVQFVYGSFIPPGAEAYAERAHADNTELSWLNTNTDTAYEELGLDPDDFDLVFAYPWPGEEQVIEGLFNNYCCQGALLLTYTQCESVRLQRKVGRGYSS